MSTGQGLWHTFRPPGPKAEGWLYSSVPQSYIIGPYGSAKTSTAGAKCMVETCRQLPSKVDGIRKAQIACVRPNYRRMHDTLIPSFRNFFGKEGKWDLEKKGPTDFYLQWEERGEQYRMHLTFRAFGDESIESFVRGFQPTAWYINEWDELPRGALSKMKSRAGRYLLHERMDLTPEQIDQLTEEQLAAYVPQYCKVFGDTNMPDLDNWSHELVLGQPDPQIEVYLQPSGFSPNAENLVNLRLIDPNYYENMAADFRREGDESSVKRFIENKPGYTPSGKPVYPMFSTERHLPEIDMKPDPHRQLLIGLDQGGQAAAIIGQKTRKRTLALFREVVLPEGTFYGGDEFGRKVGRVLLDEFGHWVRPGRIRMRHDPAGLQRHSGSSEDNPRNWCNDFLDGFCAETGLRDSDVDFLPAPTNDIKRRVGSVKKLLILRTHDGEEGFQMNRSCMRASRGFAGGYKYTQKQGRPGEYNIKPDKNSYADIHDAIQCLGLEVVPELAEEERQSNEPHASLLSKIMMARPEDFDNETPSEIMM